MVLRIDWTMYRDLERKRGGAGELDSVDLAWEGTRDIAQKICSHAFTEHRPIYEVFRESILPGCKKQGDEWVSPKELLHIAMYCGPQHNWAEAIVVLYFALQLNPGNVRKRIRDIFEQAGRTRKPDRITQIDIVNAEFYLGLPDGTLRDLETGGRL